MTELAPGNQRVPDLSGDVSVSVMPEVPGAILYDVTGEIIHAPDDGEDCALCKRRKPHPRKPSTPRTRPKHFHVPTDEAEAFDDMEAEAAKHLGIYDQPYFKFKLYSLALYLVLQDETLRGFASRGTA